MTVDFEEYQAGRFAGTARTPHGREMWAFLSDPKTILAMEVASDLGQPAVAGIEEALLKRFGDYVLLDRVKQLIGHMVRQLMEREGFVVDQSNVKIGSVPFSKGTRYRRPDWYRLHVFRNSSDVHDLCFTDTRGGEKLPPPPSGAKWRFWNSFSTTLRGTIAFGIDSRKVQEEVSERGFCRHRRERVVQAGR